ncbi:MepB family protein [Taibaiella lutea]|uniref:MepB family protein n=2 Tax=Taibaiella lutea TaxID=2608001 RepID=A0A5M6CRC4_9BACT|nr:MepB family protein [Taibaiella lutea]
MPAFDKVMIGAVYTDFLIVKESVYDLCGFNCTHFQSETESKAYQACSFKLNHSLIIYRTAKITPKKIGQFVALWKRDTTGCTMPFELSDAFELIVINARDKAHFGQFILPKAILEAKGIISSQKEGKRGIRVYPPWEDADNKQARKTQQWQLDYFLDIPINGEAVDIERAVKLYQS